MAMQHYFLDVACIREGSLIMGRGGGLQYGRGASEVLPLPKRGQNMF